jgi:hypothetical protein
MSPFSLDSSRFSIAPPIQNDRPEPDPDLESKGIRCRDCGCGHFYTLRTTKVFGGRVMRERVCRHCGKRIRTYERAFE